MDDKKTVVVTGGASGIGEATAHRFARAGWQVVIGDINEARGEKVATQIGEAGGACVYVKLDVRAADAVQEFAETVYLQCDRVDALVNSGGILQNAVRTIDLDMDEFDQIFAVNVRGTMLVNQVFGRHMIAAGAGSIVNMCSLTTFRASPQPAYAPGKAAIKSMTETLAAELGPKGVRVNAVAPGYVLTPAMQARIDEGKRDPGAVIERTAMGRFVRASEVAEVIYFLCSEGASAVTGTTIPVDCGWLVSTAYGAYASQIEDAT
ncbi:MAG: SDR family oxidoreductase [Alphaproteobacteria bacterium]|nr:SDR family oxidoreductase [Alphaproteobacteria bacterium]